MRDGHGTAYVRDLARTSCPTVSPEQKEALSSSMSATSTSVINDPRKASFVLEGVRLTVSRLGCVRASSNRAQLQNL